MPLDTTLKRLRAAACLLGLAAAGPAAAQTSVWTQHNDNGRTGANLKETVLNTGNVNARHFGRLFARAVDGQVYAQPLYVPGVRVPGRGVHNVVYVATEHNSLYAFDADDPRQAAPLWHVNFGPSAPTPNADFGNGRYGIYQDLTPEIGITSTPVISFARKTLYVCAFVKRGPGDYVHQLHALDVRTGRERPGSPAAVAGQFPVEDREVAFDPRLHMQRPGLLLAGGVVYLGFASHADQSPYHGWLMGYDAATLRARSVFCTTPDGDEGGIWQAGQGPAADAAGHLYVQTGNGEATAAGGGEDYGQCFLKLTPAPDRPDITDWFIPYNAPQLNDADADIGGSGPLLVPNSTLMVGGGKNGVLYVLDRTHLGHAQKKDDGQIVQSFPACAGHIHGSPVFWDGARSGPTVYVWGEHDYLKAFRLANGRLLTTPASQGPDLPGPGMPGGFLSVSADGARPGTGVVWASTPLDDDANHRSVPGVLRAYDAADVSRELWNSRQDPARDDPGDFAKFCPPTVVNGKVYLATFSKQLVVYGLLPAATRQVSRK